MVRQDFILRANMLAGSWLSRNSHSQSSSQFLFWFALLMTRPSHIFRKAVRLIFDRLESANRCLPLARVHKSGTQRYAYHKNTHRKAFERELATLRRAVDGYGRSAHEVRLGCMWSIEARYGNELGARSLLTYRSSCINNDNILAPANLDPCKDGLGSEV